MFLAISGVAGLVACAPAGAPPLAAGRFAPVSIAALSGATPDVINADFGPPALRRVDGAAQVWLYHSTTCGMNLFLYPDATGIPRVAAVVPDNGDPAACVASFRRAPTIAAALEHPYAS
jgi:hypothetical protein